MFNMRTYVYILGFYYYLFNPIEFSSTFYICKLYGSYLKHRVQMEAPVFISVKPHFKGIVTSCVEGDKKNPSLHGDLLSVTLSPAGHIQR